jgi:hypothetical protein
MLGSLAICLQGFGSASMKGAIENVATNGHNHVPIKVYLQK